MDFLDLKLLELIIILFLIEMKVKLMKLEGL